MLKIPPFVIKHKIYILSVILVLFFLALALLSPTSYGGADDFVHYRFAKYSFKYPHLLLDHWAKPVFTLLASPFAQLGYWGVKLFNILVGAFTGFILWKTAKIIELKRREYLIVFLFFTPVYTTMVLSGMTEILFGFVLTLAVYLSLGKKFIWSAIVISFLPLVRTEGIVIWPVFLVAFAICRSWKALPFLLTGSIVYSSIGGLYFKDFLWLIHNMPYTGTYDIYGHGELLHFAKSNKIIFGIPLTLLFFVGIISLLFKFLKNKVSVTLELILILAPLLTFYAAHSYVWWKGINSLGLIRVMAGVAPLFVLISLRGFNILIDGISIRELKTVVAAAFSLLIITTPFKVYEIPLELSPNNALVKSAAEWYNTSIYKERKFYVWDSYFYFFLGTNPYDTNKMADGIPNRAQPELDVKPGEIVIWDAHFSAVDGRFPLEGIIDNPYYKLIRIFRPAVPFKAGGGDYQICFFERLATKSTYNNRKILDSLIQTNLKAREFEILNQRFQDIEGLVAKSQEFYLLKEIKILKETAILKIKITTKGEPMFLVVSKGSKRKISYYKSHLINTDNKEITSILEATDTIPKLENRKESVKIYLWNSSKNEAIIEAIEIKLIK